MCNRPTPVPTCYPDLEFERELEHYAQRNEGRIGIDLIYDAHLNERATVPATADDTLTDDTLAIEVDVCFDSMRLAEAVIEDAAPATLRSGGDL